MINNEEDDLFNPTIALSLNDTNIAAVDDDPTDDSSSPDLYSLGFLRDGVDEKHTLHSDDSFAPSILTRDPHDDETSSDDSFSFPYL